MLGRGVCCEDGGAGLAGKPDRSWGRESAGAGGGGEDGGAGSRERAEETAGDRPQLLPPTEGATARTEPDGDG